MKIVLISKDGDKFPVSLSIMKISNLINEMMSEMMAEEDENTEIPLPNVDTPTMKLIVGYCNYQENGDGPKLSELTETNKPIIDYPLHSTNMADAVPKWYAVFVDSKTAKELLSLLNAANYMMINSLVELISAKISTMVINKDAKEIREMFSIVYDFSNEEKVAFEKEHAWVHNS